MRQLLRTIRAWLLGSFFFLKKHLTNVITFIEAIKVVVNNPGVNLLVLSTKNKYDDIILNVLKNHIDDLLKLLNVSKECLEKTELSDKVKCFVEKLSEYPEWIRDAFYLQLASYIVSKEQDLKKHEANTIVQNYYNIIKERNELPQFELPVVEESEKEKTKKREPSK